MLLDEAMNVLPEGIDQGVRVVIGSERAAYRDVVGVPRELLLKFLRFARRELATRRQHLSQPGIWGQLGLRLGDLESSRTVYQGQSTGNDGGPGFLFHEAGPRRAERENAVDSSAD